MRLRRLELQGFKSFLDRTVLTFQPGITGVVGPNGCGKSNIVDAIQWVMGEQSAKHLRGDNMTDVIFNGSDTRQPTSMAEVCLILEREGVPLAPQFASFDKSEEIAITRRVYRDGSSEYLINKVVCRLKDIHELFMDTGVGKRAYSIIEQGQIDRMINVKAEDRRYLFEEVAGITKYKAKRREAEKKLEATRQNILRLHDIIQELEKQIRSLKVQATRAKRYKELKTELEAVDLYLLGRNLFQHKKQIDDLTDKQQALVNERSQSDARFSEMDAELTRLEVLRIDQEKLLQQLTQQERDLSLLIQRLESSRGLLDERQKHLLETLEQNRAERKELTETSISLNEEVEKETDDKAAVSEQLSGFQDFLRELEVQLKDQQGQKARLQNQRDQLFNQKNQLAHRQITLQTTREHSVAREEELQVRRTDLDQKKNEWNSVLDSHRASMIVADQKIEDCKQRGEKAEREVATLHSECQQISANLSAIEEKIYKTREEFHSEKSRLESLRELQQNLEGYSPTAQEILLRLEGHPELTGRVTPLAEVVTPKAEIEEHLELLLGQDMNTLLVTTAGEAETLTRIIQGRGLERVRILAVEEIQNRPRLDEMAGERVESILSMIQIKEGFTAAANWWLGNVFVAENQDDLFRLRKQFPDRTFISKDTKTVGHVDRSFAAGAVPTKTGVFTRRREIEELAVVSANLETRLAQENSEREALLNQLQTQEKLHAELKDLLSSIHIESVEHRKEKEKIQLDLSRAERDLSACDRELERNQQQIGEIRAQIERANQELVDLKAQEEKIAAELGTFETRIQETVSKSEALGLQVNEKHIERSRAEERLQSLEYKLQKLRSELDNLSDRVERLKVLEEQGEKEVDAIRANQEEIRAQEASSIREKNEALARLSDTQNAFSATCNEIGALRDAKSELQKKREEVLGEIQDIELKLTHEKSNFEHLCGISLERYQREPQPIDESVSFDLNQAPLFMSQLSVEWEPLPETERKTLLEEHLKALREKVSRYGEVNLTAIQEFDEIQKRYDFLTEQRTDLEKSIGILEDAIKRIDETTRIRFSETFEAVNEKFKEIFPILFAGGKAELTLVQTEGQLDTGVDIMAQPPGKRLQSITLLSGGEKALTAVSLILAIFARKPSPFCLLDEVDAPLDDANVSRFNTVIRKMAEKTQFIVITHNKKTMEIAEALYGVTMERAGVSKMTSVRLN